MRLSLTIYGAMIIINVADVKNFFIYLHNLHNPKLLLMKISVCNRHLCTWQNQPFLIAIHNKLHLLQIIEILIKKNYFKKYIMHSYTCEPYSSHLALILVLNYVMRVIGPFYVS